MKRILVFLALASCALAGTWIASPGKGSHSAAASLVSFSDDFNRANSDSLGANWTEAAGDQDILSNTLSCVSNGHVENIAAYTGATTSTANQYVKATMDGNGAAGCYPCLVVRYSASGSPMYKIFFWVDENSTTFTRAASAGDGSYTTVQSAAMTVDRGDSYGVTCTGSGTSVVVRIWRNPTANTPVSATEWDSGDTTPDVTFTNDPASPVNTGTTVGVGGEHGNIDGAITWDNFYGGDLP